MKSVKEVLKDTNVINDLKPLNDKNNVNNLDTNDTSDIEEYLESLNVKRFKTLDVVSTLTSKLNDEENRNFYIKLANSNPHEKILEALSVTLDAKNRGLIKTSVAKYFVGVSKNMYLTW